mgnify:CR=1 FL=1
MNMATQYTEEFKNDAVRYWKEHPELGIAKWGAGKNKGLYAESDQSAVRRISGRCDRERTGRTKSLQTSPEPLLYQTGFPFQNLPELHLPYPRL